MASAFIICNFSFYYSLSSKKKTFITLVINLVQVYKCCIASMLYNLTPSEGGNHVHVCLMCVLVTHSCPTLCDPMGCSPLGSSMEFSRQDYWSGLPFPSPGDLTDPEIKPWFPALQADSTGRATKPTESFICSLIHSLLKITLIKLYCC